MRVNNTPHNKQRGFSMIELLIAIIVLSIGLLGFAGLQLTSLRNSNSSYTRSQAVVLTYDIIDRMRLNADGVTNDFYNNVDISCSEEGCTLNAPATDCISEPCTAAQLAVADLFAWQSRLDSELASASATIRCEGDCALYEIAVTWREINRNRDLGDENDIESHTVRTGFRP